MKKGTSLWLFLIGLGSQTQFHFVGSIGISELPIFLIAPFLYFKNFRRIRRDGFNTLVLLAIASCVGCIVSSLVNQSPFIFLIKAFAFPYAIFAATVVFHHFLRDNLDGMKWFLLGVFFSLIVNVFVFQPAVHTYKDGYIVTGEDAVAAMMGYALFWTHRIKMLICLPVFVGYLSMPLVYSFFALVAAAGISIFYSSGSGRSAALVSLLAAVLILKGGKKKASIAGIGRHFLLYILIGACLLFAMKSVYSYAASNGLLGFDAQTKYMRQTSRGTGIIDLLMGGRMETFCGLQAALDRPIMGHGAKAEDRNGYVERYLEKYGSSEDLQRYLESLLLAVKRGLGGYRFIPLHSYIISFWVQYGIIGLFFWLYVLYLVFMYFKHYASAIPQWYGYLCVSISAFIWDVIFSPFSDRLGVSFMICCILFVKSVYEHRLMLPYKMEIAVQK